MKIWSAPIKPCNRLKKKPWSTLSVCAALRYWRKAATFTPAQTRRGSTLLENILGNATNVIFETGGIVIYHR
ncbi:hypothetical protein HUU40_24735 [candidate division KSB1 bacterium]|nr:hypothetical protein [candidate division KSB1 bacterium]